MPPAVVSSSLAAVRVQVCRRCSLAAWASARDISANGTSDGVHGSLITQSSVTRSAGTRPARTSEDLPLPDGPSTGMIAPSRLRLGGSTSCRSWSIWRSRPKNTAAYDSSKARSPGYGERDASQRASWSRPSAVSGDADPLWVDGVGRDLQPLQVRGERVRVAAVDQQREDRLAQPAGQRQLGVAPLAGVRRRRGDEDDRVTGVEVREQLVAPGLPGDQPARRVEVEEDRLVAEVGQGVLHLRREHVVGGGVGHEELRSRTHLPRRRTRPGSRAIITAQATPVKINAVSEEPAATPDAGAGAAQPLRPELRRAARGDARDRALVARTSGSGRSSATSRASSRTSTTPPASPTSRRRT